MTRISSIKGRICYQEDGNSSIPLTGTVIYPVCEEAGVLILDIDSESLSASSAALSIDIIGAL